MAQSIDETPPSDDLANISRLLIFAPFVGGALALSFDVGVFWGLAPDFFTLFSLSEHIVFALSALPVALLVTLSLFGLFAQSRRARAGSHGSKANRKSALYAHILRLQSLRLVRLGVAVISFAAFNLAYFKLTEWWPRFSIPFGVMAIASLVGIIIFFNPRTKRIVRWLLALIVVMSFAMGFGAFLVVSTSDVLRTFQSATDLSGKVFHGQLIRSGEKGVLFRGCTGTVVFIKWDQLSKIENSVEPKACGI